MSTLCPFLCFTLYPSPSHPSLCWVLLAFSQVREGQMSSISAWAEAEPSCSGGWNGAGGIELSSASGPPSPGQLPGVGLKVPPRLNLRSLGLPYVGLGVSRASCRVVTALQPSGNSLAWSRLPSCLDQTLRLLTPLHSIPELNHCPHCPSPSLRSLSRTGAVGALWKPSAGGSAMSGGA